MNRCALSLRLFVCSSIECLGATPKLRGVGTAIQEKVTKNEVAGAVGTKKPDALTKRTLTLPVLLLLSILPSALQAQFTLATNNGALTITRYTGSSVVVVV